MDHEGSFGLGETLHDARTATSDAVSKAADQMKDRFDEGTNYARNMIGQLNEILPGKDTSTRAQSSLADLLERQPLVLGAIGLAVGVAVAGAFQSSDLENEWVGEYSDSVKGELNERAGAVSQSVREAADTLMNEIKDAGIETFDRVKQAGMDVAEAAGKKVRAP
jgi:gas vesicle protein